MITQNKQEAFEHICYEMQRLHVVYQRWLCRRGQRRHQDETNDLIELILLHTRTLLDFFEFSRQGTKVRPKPAHRDDILSEDFDFPAAEVSIDQKIKKRIDQEVAHLSYARCGLSRKQKEWRFDAFVPPMLGNSYKFLRACIKRFGRELNINLAGYISITLHDLEAYKDA